MIKINFKRTYRRLKVFIATIIHYGELFFFFKRFIPIINIFPLKERLKLFQWDFIAIKKNKETLHKCGKKYLLIQIQIPRQMGEFKWILDLKINNLPIENSKLNCLPHPQKNLKHKWVSSKTMGIVWMYAHSNMMLNKCLKFTPDVRYNQSVPLIESELCVLGVYPPSHLNCRIIRAWNESLPISCELDVPYSVLVPIPGLEDSVV